jgi:DNA-binding NarL/FixJ family response regulator
MAPPVRILIVDDHKALAEGLQNLLDKEPAVEVVGVAHDGRGALELAGSTQADVMLLDIGLPDMDGIEVCAQLASGHPMLKVLALSMHQEEAFVTAMLEAGAKGYLIKSAGRGEILEAIASVVHGGTHFSPEVTQLLINRLVSGQRAGKATEPWDPGLTERESEVLQLIVQEHTSAEIAGKLHIGVSTVETHRRHLMEKLGARNSAGLVRIAMERGLLRD